MWLKPAAERRGVMLPAIRMGEKFRNISIQLIADEQTPVNSEALATTWFGRRAFSFDERHIVASLSDRFNKDESLGELWSDLKPTRAGWYTVELAVELSSFLPNVEGNAEYSVAVGGAHYFVCNRMVRAYWGDGFPKEGVLKYFIVHRLALKDLSKSKGLEVGLHAVPMRSFISRRFRGKAASAEKLIEEMYLDWQASFVDGIYRLVKAVKSVDPLWSKSAIPHPSTAAYRVVWVLLKGTGPGIGCQQFTADFGLSAFRPQSSVGGQAARRLKRILNQPELLQPFDEAIELARTFVHYRLFELAIVQISLACESILSRVVESRLQGRGVPRKIMEDLFDEITYSQHLNFHLPTLLRLSSLQNHEQVLADINWARKRRNEIIHKGRSKKRIDGGQVNKVFSSAVGLIEFLRTRL